jgi:hypothetical protein
MVFLLGKWFGEATFRMSPDEAPMASLPVALERAVWMRPKIFRPI